VRYCTALVIGFIFLVHKLTLLHILVINKLKISKLEFGTVSYKVYYSGMSNNT